MNRFPSRSISIKQFQLYKEWPTRRTGSEILPTRPQQWRPCQHYNTETTTGHVRKINLYQKLGISGIYQTILILSERYEINFPCFPPVNLFRFHPSRTTEAPASRRHIFARPEKSHYGQGWVMLRSCIYWYILERFRHCEIESNSE